MFVKCENSSLCHLCDGVSLYKNTQEERLQKEKQRIKNKEAKKKALFKTHNPEKKEGMAFEKEVVRRWNSANQEKDDSPILKQYEKQRVHQKPRLGEFINKENVSKNSKDKDPSPPRVNLSSLQGNKKTKDLARQQSNSGALWFAKGDVITEEYLMECKERGTLTSRGEKTISIPKEWLTKQEKEAFQEKRPYWILPFRYKNDDEIYLVKTFDQELEMYQKIKDLTAQVEKLSRKIKVK